MPVRASVSNLKVSKVSGGKEVSPSLILGVLTLLGILGLIVYKNMEKKDAE